MTTLKLRERASAGDELLGRPEVDTVWVELAESLGFRVRRTDAAYATFDGAGTIAIGSPETLDPSDTVAQLIFHELCHALVQGETALDRVDWGLDNTSDRDRVRELACLRVQAVLADRHGLRLALAPTTVVRADYLALKEDPLTGDDEAALLARDALWSPLFARWWPALDAALARTARLANLAVHTEP